MEYFMLRKYNGLEGEGLLHVCISSTYINHTTYSIYTVVDVCLQILTESLQWITLEFRMNLDLFVLVFCDGRNEFLVRGDAFT